MYSFNYSREYYSNRDTIYKVAHRENMVSRLRTARLNHVDTEGSIKIFLRFLSFREVLNITYYTQLHTLAHYNNYT